MQSKWNLHFACFEFLVMLGNNENRVGLVTYCQKLCVNLTIKATVHVWDFGHSVLFSSYLVSHDNVSTFAFTGLMMTRLKYQSLL